MKYKMKTRCKGGAHGFTLVELLVVISIIALLITLLTPGLQRARDSATATVCRSNLRTTGMAHLEFAMDHRGLMFPRDIHNDYMIDFGETPPQRSNWVRWLHRRGYLPGRFEEPNKLKTLFCPLNFPSGEREATHSYGLRAWNGTRATLDRGLQMSLVEAPARFFTLVDSIHFTSGVQWYTVQQSVGSNAIHLRHGGMANTYYLDGSVKATEAHYFQSLPEVEPEFTARPFRVMDESGSLL